MIINTDELRKEMEDIAGLWDGDNPGRAEDRAHLANDILDAIKQLETLVTNYQNDDF